MVVVLVASTHQLTFSFPIYRSNLGSKEVREQGRRTQDYSQPTKGQNSSIYYILCPSIHPYFHTCSSLSWSYMSVRDFSAERE